MDARAVQALALRVAEALPGACREFPFGPEHEVARVAGKMFLLVTDEPGAPVAVIKCDPADSLALQAEFADITPGYHMNKRHWITLHGGGSLPPELIEQLVTDSYLLVRAGLPRARRPALPDDLVR